MTHTITSCNFESLWRHNDVILAKNWKLRDFASIWVSYHAYAILNVIFHMYLCFHCKSLPRSKIHPFFLGDSIFFIIWQCVTRNYSSQIFIRAICGQSSRSKENTPSHTEIWGHCALYKGYFFLTLGDFSGG